MTANRNLMYFAMNVIISSVPLVKELNLKLNSLEVMELAIIAMASSKKDVPHAIKHNA